MSFYIVPSVSFQTQQKLKKGGAKTDKDNDKERDKDKHRHKRKSKKAGDKSKNSSISHSGSSPASSTNASIRTGSIYEEPHEDRVDSVNTAELANNLEQLKKDTSAGPGLMKPSKMIESQPPSVTQSPSQLDIDNSGINNGHLSSNPLAKHQTLPNGDPLEPFSPHLEFRRNSASTTSSFPRHKYRRNSSLSSSHTGSSISTKDISRPKMTSNMSTGSPLNVHNSPGSAGSNYESNAESDKSSRIFKPSYTMSQQESLPEFKTIRDLSMLNSLQKMSANIYSPSFQVFRFSNFLDILSSQHMNDPIHFANIRLNSMSKFLLRHSAFSKISTEQALNGNDIREIEGAMAYNLIAMRTFIRSLIKSHSTKDVSRTEIFSCEELVQVNFTNYIRYLLNLPSKILTIPPEQLDEVSLMHQKFKSMFVQAIKGLHNFKREDTGDDSTDASTSIAAFLQLITELSYDFILLEKYHLNILTKLTNNSLIDTRILSKLFKSFDSSLSTAPNKRMAPKVLIYNSYFSSQYSWYLSVTIPFLRVIEANVFNENATLIGDLESYQKNQRNLARFSFDKQDPVLYKSHFDKLKFESFNHFRSYTFSQLVNIQRTADDSASVSSDSSNTTNAHKPKNFQFYTDSLATIEDGQFDIIQSRDLLFQLTSTNHMTIITEFYRVLKVGGTLDIPIILSGSDTIEPGKSIVRFPRFTNTTGVNLSDYYDMIPNFAEVLLTAIMKIFGEGNVKYSTVLLNTSAEITNFLVKDIGLHVAEMIGKTDGYCEAFEASLGKERPDIHFFFHIQATKV